MENEEDSLLVESEELIIRKKKIIHPFIKLLLVFWPFGEAFQALRIWGKIYEIVKVYMTTAYMYIVHVYYMCYLLLVHVLLYMYLFNFCYY